MLAEVFVNGKNLVILWTSPFRINITDAVHAGKNELELRVTNTWLNRMIGNEQLLKMKEAQREGKPESAQLNNQDLRLQEAGLIGPVLLRSSEYYDT
jgi:hypothetical protein